MTTRMQSGVAAGCALVLPIAVAAIWPVKAAERTELCAKVTMVGTAAAQPVPGRVGPSTVISVGDRAEDCGGRMLVFDLGRGAVTRIIDSGLWATQQVEAVFASHVHSDHVMEMGDLAYFDWINRYTSDYTGLDFYAPAGDTAENIRHSLDNLQVDISLRALGGDAGTRPARVNVIDYPVPSGAPEVIYSQDGITVYVVGVRHFSEDAVAWLIAIEDVGTVVISGDINNKGGPDIAKLGGVGHVDLVVHEVISEKQDPRGNYHTTPAQVAANATALQADQLVLTHLLPAPGYPNMGLHFPNAPYLLEDDFVFPVEQGGYQGEVIVADDLTSVYLPSKVVLETCTSQSFWLPIPDGYVPSRPEGQGEPYSKQCDSAEVSGGGR